MMTSKYFFILFLSLILPFHAAQALINLDVVLIHKKGIDKDLILVSEIQSKERVFGRESVQLNLKNEIKLVFQAEFVNDSTYGPSAYVALIGNVVNVQNKKLMEFGHKDSKVALNEERVFTYQSEDQDQIIEVRIRPYLE